MARKNIPLTIVRPGVEELHKVVYVANADAQTNMIPYRYPFADIENYQALKDKGFFRHATTDVATDLGGVKTADAATTLGYQLPPTEKLILLCKVTSALTADKHIVITVKGSQQYGIPNVVYKIAEDGSVDTDADLVVVSGDEFEIDLFNFGLLLDANGEIEITADGNAATNADDAKVSFALVARTL
jgi:hypothetical protein